jgi:hypothetical protein
MVISVKAYALWKPCEKKILTKFFGVLPHNVQLPERAAAGKLLSVS